ncbi:MAG: ATP-binding cassette domain-containing protein [Pseudomonadota bacterium]
MKPDFIKSDLEPGKPLWFWLLPQKSIILPLIVATMTVNVLALAIPLATMNIFDRVISNSAFGTLWALIIGVVLAGAFEFLLRTLRAVMIDRSSASVDLKMTGWVFGRILNACASARVLPVGVQANALRELDGIREYFNSLSINVLGDLPFVLLFLFVIAAVSGVLVIVPLLAVPIIFLVVAIAQIGMRKQAEASFQDSAHKNSVAVDVTSGIETIAAVGAKSWAAKRWEAAVASQMHHSLCLRLWTSTSVQLVSFLQSLTTAALLVVGVYLVTAGNLTPGALFAANLLTYRCIGPVAAMATILSRLHQIRMALESVNQIIQMDQEKLPGSNPLRPAALREPIAFEKVSFAYEPLNGAVLNEMSITIKPGERVGIIGAIGSGKTTLLKLMVNMYQPNNGRILWNRIPIQHYDVDLLREQFGTVFQNATFFRGTIWENIVLGRTDVSDETLLQALEISGAYAWLKALPQGLETLIGEAGQGLSNGQRQTLAIARGFLGDRSCYLLDEPTSDLDTDTERAFVNRLKALERQKTVIIVTHKQSVLEAVDRLIILQQGRVIMDGPKHNLIQELQSAAEHQKSKVA